MDKPLDESSPIESVSNVSIIAICTFYHFVM